jgi:hypothetical protein
MCILFKDGAVEPGLDSPVFLLASRRPHSPLTSVHYDIKVC